MNKFWLLFYFTLFIFACKKPNEQRKSSYLNPDLDKAYEFSDENHTDSAYLYFNLAKDVALANQDSLMAGNALINMAIISNNEGDSFGAIELLLESIKLIDSNVKENAPYLVSAYNTLGMSHANLNENKAAIEYYKQSIKYSSNKSSNLITENNIANSYRYMGDYKQSLEIFERLLKSPNSKLEYARALANYAYSKFLYDRNYNAAPELLKALNIRIQEKDIAGQNSNYSYLSDFYADKNPKLAIYYAKNFLRTATLTQNAIDQAKAIKELARLSSPSQSKIYYDQYIFKTDSLTNVRNKAKNQFALIRYEAEKHKQQNKILLEENTLKSFQITRQKVIIVLILFVLIFGFIAGYLLYLRKKQKLKTEAEQKLKNSQLTTSKKVHDLVANGLYKVMTEMENLNTKSNAEVLNDLDILYQISRDITYDEIQYDGNNFNEKISNLVKSFASDTVKIAIIGNTPELWKKVDQSIKYEIENVIQELLVNMNKHSGATSVLFRFEQEKNNFQITYSDNGKGLGEVQKIKNGLTNAGNRMNKINGTINFDSKPGKNGLIITLSFPLNK